MSTIATIWGPGVGRGFGWGGVAEKKQKTVKSCHALTSHDNVKSNTSDCSKIQEIN